MKRTLRNCLAIVAVLGLCIIARFIHATPIEAALATGFLCFAIYNDPGKDDSKDNDEEA